MKTKYVIVNLQTANNCKDTYEEAEEEAKLKTKNSAAIYGIFKLVAVTKVPVPDIKVEKIVDEIIKGVIPS